MLTSVPCIVCMAFGRRTCEIIPYSWKNRLSSMDIDEIYIREKEFPGRSFSTYENVFGKNKLPLVILLYRLPKKLHSLFFIASFCWIQIFVSIKLKAKTFPILVHINKLISPPKPSYI